MDTKARKNAHIPKEYITDKEALKLLDQAVAKLKSDPNRKLK